MCGIAGIIGNVPPDRNILNKLLESISHRGPDHRGFFYEKRENSAGVDSVTVSRDGFSIFRT